MAGNPTLEPDQQEALREVVTEACVEMFTSCGFAVRVLDLSTPIAPHAHDIAGFIGFAGSVRGSLMVAGPSKLFRSTFPPDAAAGSVTKTDLFDWTAELANQLLGRVNRRFCERGRDFEASTPTAIEGRELNRRFPGRAGVLDLVLAVGGDVVSICFEVTPPPNGKLFPHPAKPIEVRNEGDVVLF